MLNNNLKDQKSGESVNRNLSSWAAHIISCLLHPWVKREAVRLIFIYSISQCHGVLHEPLQTWRFWECFNCFVSYFSGKTDHDSSWWTAAFVSQLLKCGFWAHVGLPTLSNDSSRGSSWLWHWAAFAAINQESHLARGEAVKHGPNGFELRNVTRTACLALWELQSVSQQTQNLHDKHNQACVYACSII